MVAGGALWALPARTPRQLRQHLKAQPPDSVDSLRTLNCSTLRALRLLWHIQRGAQQLARDCREPIGLPPPPPLERCRLGVQQLRPHVSPRTPQSRPGDTSEFCFVSRSSWPCHTLIMSGHNMWVGSTARALARGRRQSKGPAAGSLPTAILMWQQGHQAEAGSLLHPIPLASAAAQIALGIATAAGGGGCCAGAIHPSTPRETRTAVVAG